TGPRNCPAAPGTRNRCPAPRRSPQHRPTRPARRPKRSPPEWQPRIPSVCCPVATQPLHQDRLLTVLVEVLEQHGDRLTHDAPTVHRQPVRATQREPRLLHVQYLFPGEVHSDLRVVALSSRSLTAVRGRFRSARGPRPP